FREHAVRSRRPLPAPDRFYRNNVVMRDDPRTLDRTTLLLTFLYKFARHEWVGISAAWDVTPTLADSVYVTDKIRRHLSPPPPLSPTNHPPRHEWVGISAAWDVTPTLADSVYVTDKISRYHLA